MVVRSFASWVVVSTSVLIVTPFLRPSVRLCVCVGSPVTAVWARCAMPSNSWSLSLCLTLIMTILCCPDCWMSAQTCLTLPPDSIERFREIQPEYNYCSFLWKSELKTNQRNKSTRIKVCLFQCQSFGRRSLLPRTNSQPLSHWRPFDGGTTSTLCTGMVGENVVSVVVVVVVVVVVADVVVIKVL